MKVKIRRGCFETNSSSMHSIVITSDDRVYTQDEFNDGVYINKNGEWHNWEDELYFERSPFTILSTYESKLRYAIAEFCGSQDEEAIDKYGPEFDRITAKHYSEFDHFSFNKIYKRAFADKNGKELPMNDVHYYWGDDQADHYYYYDGDEKVEATRLPYDYECNNYGHIDHQSAGTLESFLKSHNITLEEFLTNKKYIIIVDGDEYCEFDKLLSSGLVDKKKIVEVYPRRIWFEAKDEKKN